MKRHTPVIIAAFAALLAAPLTAAAAIDFYKLPRISQIALPPDGADDALLLATPSGVLRLGRDGSRQVIGLAGTAVSLLVADPGDRGALLASGRKSGEENLGLLRSTDGGRSWRPYAAGARKPAMFSALTASAADPRSLYAYYQGLQASTDGGKSWALIARGPWDLWSLAASAGNASILYSAGRGGLQRSSDGGRHWQNALDVPNATGAVTVTPTGTIYAFVIGRGLIRSQEPALDWQAVNNRLGEQVITQLLVDPARPERLVALTHVRNIIESLDAGQTWSKWGGEREPRSAAERRGLALYRTNCAACHGERGIGEVITDPLLADPDYLRAPALNDFTHAWHHEDEGMVKSILEGSPREPRMRGQKDVLSSADAHDVVAYIKSLWGAKALSCQGQRHMKPECQR